MPHRGRKSNHFRGPLIVDGAYLAAVSLKQLSGETLIYGLSSVLGRLASFVLLTPLVSRVMDEQEFGQTGSLFFWTGLLIALLYFRMDTALFRFASRGEYDRQAVFRRAQGFVTTLTLTVIGLLFLYFQFVWTPTPIYPRVYVYLVLFISGLDALGMVPLARLRLEQRPWFFVTVQLGNVAVSIVLIYFFLFWLPRYADPKYPYGVDFKVGYYLIAFAVASALRYLALVIDGWFRPAASEERPTLDAPLPTALLPPPPLRRLLAYSLPLTVVSAAGIANALVGPAILEGAYPVQAGYYTAALRIAVFLNLFVTAYQYAAEPFFFRRAGSDLATADRGIYADALRAYGIVGTLAASGVYILLPWLQFFVGADVRPGMEVVPILLVANFLFGIYSNLSIAYKLTDKTFLGGGIALIGSLFAVGGPLLLVGRYGMYAPATGMLLCFSVMCLLAYRVSRRHFPVPYPFGRIAIYVVLALGACWLAGYGEPLWYRVILLLLLVSVVFALERAWLVKTFLGGAAGEGERSEGKKK